jgi:hypothetical protein
MNSRSGGDVDGARGSGRGGVVRGGGTGGVRDLRIGTELPIEFACVATIRLRRAHREHIIRSSRELGESQCNFVECRTGRARRPPRGSSRRSRGNHSRIPWFCRPSRPLGGLFVLGRREERCRARARKASRAGSFGAVVSAPADARGGRLVSVAHDTEAVEKEFANVMRRPQTRTSFPTCTDVHPGTVP